MLRSSVISKSAVFLGNADLIRGLCRTNGAMAFRFFSQDAPELSEEEKEAQIRAGMKETFAENQKEVTPWMVKDLPYVRSTDLPANPAELATLTGMPQKQSNRTVVIRQKTKSAMTSGLQGTKAWTITWKMGERWTNPLMGWTSTNDPMSNLTLRFDSADEAKNFAIKNGWDFELHETPEVRTVAGNKAYSHNFLPKAFEETLREEGTKNKIFTRDAPNSSHFYRYLKYHGDGEIPFHGHKK